MSASTRLRGINYRVCGVIPQSLTVDIHCFRLNLKKSKLGYWTVAPKNWRALDCKNECLHKVLYNNRATARVVIGWCLSSIREQTHRWRHCVVWLTRVIRVHSPNQFCRQSFSKLAGPQQNKKITIRLYSPYNVKPSGDFAYPQLVDHST